MRTLLLTLTLLIAVVTTQAQDVNFGVKAGLNLANINAEDDDFESRKSFHAGIFVEFGISEKFSVQPELVYSRQGSFVDTDFVIDGIGPQPLVIPMEISFNIDYLNMPVLAKFYAAEGLSFQTGPQVGVKLSAKSEIELDVDIPDFENEIDSDIEDLDTIDLSWVFGLAYRLPAGIGFDARYNLGLTSMGEDETGSFDEISRNSVFQFGVSYRF